MLEGRESGLTWALILREVPSILERFLKAADDGVALVWDSFRIGILVAHHRDSLAVNR